MANLSNMSGLQLPGSGAPQPAPAPDPHAALAGRLTAAHDSARAMFDKTGELVARADRARRGLETLTKLSDMITPDDVVREAGKLVAAGEEPLALAGLLADMPQNGGGQALAGWVQAHAVQAAQTEQRIAQAHAAAKHQLGVAALHGMQVGAAASSGQATPTATPAPAPNALQPPAALGGTT